MSKIAGDKFFRQGLRNALEINTWKVTWLADVCETELSLKEKVTKREQRTIETLINNGLVKEKAFYCLNERLVSNLTGDIIFSTRSLERFSNKHLTSDLPTRAKHNFSLK